MPLSPNSMTLRLAIELPSFADLSKVALLVNRYAAELINDLGLPTAVSVSLTGLARTTWANTALWNISIEGKPCRSRWWPEPMLPEQPAVEAVAAMVGLAIHESRELLLTSELADSIAKEWGVADANGYLNGWSATAFLSFLRAFPKYNFSLGHARALLSSETAGAATESEAAYLFEQAMEESANLVFGVGLTVSPDEYSADYKPEYEKSSKDVAKDLYSRLGLVCPEVRLSSGHLMPGEFQIQINDVRLPLIRGLARTEIVIQKNKSDVTKHGIETFELFDPLYGYWYLCAEDSPETVTKVSPDFVAGPPRLIKQSIVDAVMGNAGSLLTSPIVHLLLESLTNAPDLVKSVEARFGDTPVFRRRLTVILRRLLDEQVSMANLVGILDSLLALREVTRSQQTSVYHFSELEDSPILVAENCTMGGVDATALVSTARLGVRSLGVRNQETVRKLLPVLPLPADLATTLASHDGDAVMPDLEGKRIIELLTLVGERSAMVVNQGLRARIREQMRCEFPELPVIGSSELPRGAVAAGYQTLANIFYNAKRYAEALEAISMAKSLQPEEVTYHYELGRVYDALDRSAEATAEYQLAAQVANDPLWRAEIANTFFRRKAYKDAIALYRELAELDARNAAYFRRLGDCLRESGAFKRAIDAYRRTLELTPEEPFVHAYLGWVLYKQGEYVSNTASKRKYWTESLGEFQRAIQLKPEVAWFHGELHGPLRRLSRLDDAAQQLLEAIRLDERDVSSRLSLASCLSQNGRFTEAVQQLEAARAAFPSVLEIQVELARAYAQVDDYEKAVATGETLNSGDSIPKGAPELLLVLRSAHETATKLAADPRNAELLAALGNIQTRIGNLGAAAELYRKAASIDPSKANLEYRRLLGNTLYKLDDFEGAIRELEIVSELTPEDPLTHNNLGTAYDGLEKTARARECYQQAAMLAPDKFVPRYNLGSSNYRLGQIEAAQDAYLETVRLSDTFAPAHLNLGNCYDKLDRRDLAIAEWEKATALDTTLVEAFYNLGVAQWSAREGSEQDRVKAVACWKKALSLDPNLTNAEDNLEAAESKDKPGRREHLAIFDLVHTSGSEDPV